MKKRLENYFRASFPAVAIQTAEEQRVVADVIAAAKATSKEIATWSATEGLRMVSKGNREVPDTADPLIAMGQRPENTVLIFRDLGAFPFDRDPILARAFRDLLTWAPTAGSVVIISGPSFRPHPTVEKMVVVTDYSLPGPDDLRVIAQGIASSAKVEINGGDEVIRALSGLSTSEAENALALSVIETGRIDPGVIYREKVQGVKKSGLLEIIDPDPRGLSAIGGLGNLKAYIAKRKKAFSPEAINYGLDAPKGILLVGVPGTGKSLTAKAVGTVLGVPTLRLDIGNLFQSLVGESESRTRQALELAEALAPCVIWVDEIDKGLAGSSGSGTTDSGVTKRVFGTIISWMQERKNPVYLVATANDVTSLPPEFLRKGRWDEVFAIDLPTEDERKEIFWIHLAKRGKEKCMAAVAKATKATDSFTGSEIEAVIIEAMFNAFDEGREITEDDLVSVAENTVPLAITAREKIESIREWARTRARFSSAAPEEKTKARKIRS